MCQIVGHISTVWAANRQQSILLFTLERYISIVHWFQVTYKHVRMAILNVWISSFILEAFVFMAGRRPGIGSSGLYCTAPCEYGLL